MLYTVALCVAFNIQTVVLYLRVYIACGYLPTATILLSVLFFYINYMRALLFPTLARFR